MKEYFAKLKFLFKWRDLAFTLMLFAIILLIAFCRAETMMDVTFSEDAVDVVTDRYSMNIPYDMVESIELGKINEDDEIINGVADIALRSGVWHNEQWGEYTACMDVQTDDCIVVHLNDGRIFVFSHESNETVAEEFATFQSYLNKQ